MSKSFGLLHIFIFGSQFIVEHKRENIMYFNFNCLPILLEEWFSSMAFVSSVLHVDL
jgi:hypothetical protein